MAQEVVEITRLLQEVRAGDRPAAEALMEAVYTNLRGLAYRIFAGERPDNTLQPTALVHEAYLRIFGGENVECSNRAHFYAIAAQQMRRLLIDHGREFRAQKRGGGLKVVLDDAHHALPFDACEFDEIDDLIGRLQRVDPDAARVVEMKFFSGMTDEETAIGLGCSSSTVRRHWSFAKAWLVKKMSESAVRSRSESES